MILKRVELPVVPFDRCQNKLRETRLGAHFDLHGSFICAGMYTNGIRSQWNSKAYSVNEMHFNRVVCILGGERGKDTCRGDGGSPLVCPIGPRKYAQAGIVSWGKR